MVMYASVSLLGKHNMEWVGNGLDSAEIRVHKHICVDNYISILQRFGILGINYYYFTTYLYIILNAGKIKLLFNVYADSDGSDICMVDDLFLYLNYNTF